MNEKYRIIGVTEDFGTGKDKSGKSFEWSGYRLIVQTLTKDSATTKILKASKELDVDNITDTLSDSGYFTCGILFDEYGRAAAVTNCKG